MAPIAKEEAVAGKQLGRAAGLLVPAFDGGFLGVRFALSLAAEQQHRIAADDGLGGVALGHPFGLGCL